jgi:hypothetical protein
VDASQWRSAASHRGVWLGWRSAPGPVWMSSASRRPTPDVIPGFYAKTMYSSYA